MKDEIWAVIGGGGGGQTFAAHMALLGKRVRLHSKSQEKVDAINKKGTIELVGVINGVGRIEFATTNIAKALDGATHVVMVLPSLWHQMTTMAMVPHLKDGQFVLILPEASCGALAFRKSLKDFGCMAKLVIGAGATLPYATRAISPGVCKVIGLKTSVKIAACPAADNERLAQAFSSFKNFELCENVIATSIDNINLLVHPAPVMLNISRIEATPQQDYEYYGDGFTPSVGRLLEQIDAERIAVARAYGINQRTLKQEFIEMYSTGLRSQPLYEIIQNNPGYRGIKNARSIRERYFMEDVPYSMTSVAALGDIAGVNTPCMDAICTLARAILGNDLDEGRTAENLGIAGMTRDEFVRYVNGD